MMADDTERGKVEPDGGHEDDLLNTHGHSGGGDSFLVEVLHEPIDDKHPDGDGKHVESGGNGLSGDLFKGGNFRGEFAERNFFEEVGFLQMDPEVNDAAEVDDQGGESESGDAHFWESPPAKDEEGVEEAVGDESSNETVAVGDGVSLGREGGVEDDGEEHQNGTDEEDVHVVEAGLEVGPVCAE